MRPDLGRSLRRRRPKQQLAAHARPIRCRIRGQRRPLRARGSNTCRAGYGRGAARASCRRAGESRRWSSCNMGRGRDRRRCRRPARRKLRRGSDRRAPGLNRARQHGRLSDVATKRADHRCRPQLYLQHPPRRHRLCRCGVQAGAFAERHAQARSLRDSSQGRSPTGYRSAVPDRRAQTRRRYACKFAPAITSIGRRPDSFMARARALSSTNSRIADERLP